MRSGVRFALTLVIVLAVLLGLSLCGYNYWEPRQQAENPLGFILESASSQPVELPMCMDEQTRERVRGVILDALDHALQSHIENVFLVWLRDDRGQPGRARNGVEQGLRAYLSARKGAIDWTPPPCAG